VISRLLLALLTALGALLLLPTAASATPSDSPAGALQDCLADVLALHPEACAEPSGAAVPAPSLATPTLPSPTLPSLGAPGADADTADDSEAAPSSDGSPAPGASPQRSEGDASAAAVPGPDAVADPVGDGCEMLAGVLGLGGGCDALAGLLDCVTDPTGPACAELPDLTCETVLDLLPDVPFDCSQLPEFELPEGFCLPLGEVVGLLQGLGLDAVFDQLPQQLQDLLDGLVCPPVENLPPAPQPGHPAPAQPVVQPDQHQQPVVVVPASTGGGGGGQLAYTGLDPKPYLFGGVAALGLGAGLQRLGRRRA
jgi:hypothetical protein